MATTESTNCPRCKDTGWIADASKGDAFATRCGCFYEAQTRNFMAKARIPRRYQNCTLQNFEIHKNNASHKDALKISKKLVENYPSQEVGLLFIGPPGVGKTHLAAGILKELIARKGVSCVFYDFRDLIRDIQSTFNPDSGTSESEILAPVFESSVVVLDELGAKRSSAWVEETIFYIINQRYNQKRLTIFTSNFLDSGDEEDTRQPMFKKTDIVKPGDDSLVDRIGYRLRSRIYEMCKVVEMDGDDYRKAYKQASYRF